MAPHAADPPVICSDCHTRLQPGEPARGANGGTLCLPCFELREMAFGTLSSRPAAGGGVRRGPRHLIPEEIAARITIVRSDGTTGHAQPVREVGPHGFRAAAGGEHPVGQQLRCVATLPGRVGIPAEFDVEVRWCQRNRSDEFEIGVEVLPEDIPRYDPLYRTLLAAIRATA